MGEFGKVGNAFRPKFSKVPQSLICAFPKGFIVEGKK